MDGYSWGMRTSKEVSGAKEYGNGSADQEMDVLGVFIYITSDCVSEILVGQQALLLVVFFHARLSLPRR